MEQNANNKVASEAVEQDKTVADPKSAYGAARPAAAPAGFEAFDLDDIEVIESKVFA